MGLNAGLESSGMVLIGTIVTGELTNCDRSYDNLRTKLKIFCNLDPWFIPWTLACNAVYAPVSVVTTTQ